MNAGALPEQMHAVLLTGYGGLDRLDYRDDVPRPAPGAGEVLLRVTAAGIECLRTSRAALFSLWDGLESVLGPRR